MTPTISVIIPSKDRLEQLRSCLHQLFATTRGFDVEAVVISSAGDELINDKFAGGMTIINVDCTAVIGWNIGLTQAQGDHLVLGADDLWWYDGWLDAALEAMATLPEQSGLVGFNDLSGQARDFSTHYMMTRDFIRHYHGGVMAVPKYRHYFIDPEACQRARRADRYVYCPEAIVEHRHYMWQKSQFDDTYAAGTVFYRRDESMYKFRASAGFPDDFDRVIE